MPELRPMPMHQVAFHLENIAREFRANNSSSSEHVEAVETAARYFRELARGELG